MKKARISKSKVKAMLIVIMIEWVPKNQVVNEKYYKEVLYQIDKKCRERKTRDSAPR